jgi:ribose transport system permease protein
VNSSLLRLLRFAPLLLFVVVLLTFGLQSSKFLQPRNLANIVVQASSTGIVTVGIIFVLLTAGVDLSVGAIMFVVAALAGKATVAGVPLIALLPGMILIGVALGAFNAFFIVKIRVAAFIVTLSTLFIGRGLGLWITETRAINLPESFLQLGSVNYFGLPLPAWLFATVLILGHIVLTRTPFGRQLFAVGHNLEKARRAGLETGRILTTAYLMSGACAALAAIVSLGQLGAVSPKFGEQKEFAAIAAAVLGGTSLFGGRGNILPGAFLGAVLIQSIENGLVIVNANPYLYPMVTSIVILLAVVLESLRNRAVDLGHS